MKKQKSIDDVVEYYKDTKVIEFFAATNKSGKSRSPLFAGAALFN